MTVAQLWKVVNCKNGSTPSTALPSYITAETLNAAFVAVSTDNFCTVDPRDVASTIFSSERQATSTQDCCLCISKFTVESMLRRVKCTSPGADNLPAWFFKACSVELADIIAHLFNISIKSGSYPRRWCTALVTPIPKVPVPATASDMRPISVTSLLSRLLEGYVAKVLLQPSLPASMMLNQYAFRPTGSTTCALVHIFHRVTSLLETNRYVRCLLVDFSKAFDTVDHALLLSKLVAVEVPVSIKMWVASFLSQRSQCTNFQGNVSSARSINRGIVQGSAIGPTLFSIMISDLQSHSADNELFKYADDVTVLSAEHSGTELVEEFDNIKCWAMVNKMSINLLKTKEIVFRRPHAMLDLPLLPDIERVTTARLLGVYFTDVMSVVPHLSHILTQCSQRFYLLKSLKLQGLPIMKLKVIYSGIIISKITYAISAWGGFVSVADENRINGLLKRAFRYGYTDELQSFQQLLQHADDGLFQAMTSNMHCLHTLLPPIVSHVYNTRPRAHNMQLPSCCSALHKSSFMPRILFKQ